MDVMQWLVDKGNSILVIQHNLYFIRCVDWIIDLGPDGGDKGGEIVVVCTPETLGRIPPVIRANTSSKCCSSIRLRQWWFEGGLGGVGKEREWVLKGLGLGPNSSSGVHWSLCGPSRLLGMVVKRQPVTRKPLNT